MNFLKNKYDADGVRLFPLQITAQWISWFGDHQKSAAVLTYFMGVSFYSGLAVLFGYSFLTTFEIFIAAPIWFFVASVTLCWYEDTVCDSDIFYSRRSWFNHSLAFVCDKITDPLEKYLQKEPSKPDIFFLRFGTFFGLPICVLAGVIIAALLVIILFLDWVRIAIIGFANLCLTITSKMITWAYVLWSVLGAGSSLFFDKSPMSIAYFFIGLAIGGLVGISLTLYKDLRKMKYGTPYFHT